MSYRPQPITPVPEETNRVARAAFPKGTLAMDLRDALAGLYTRISAHRKGDATRMRLSLYRRRQV